MYFKKTPKMLLWVRYTAFIVLYPIGVLSEIKVIYDAYPVISKCCPRVFSFEMPNEWNFSFDYLYALFMIVAPGYLFGFPFLYTYMLGQRKRKLSKLD
jgi:very-long-chain (3R)-3-hydroxyacyl-CoA dehydratase